MFKRTGVLVFVVLLLACTVALGQHDAFLGTWKLDLAKSKFNSGPPPKSTTVKFEAWQDGYKVTFDTITAQGQTTHREAIFRFDGKEHPVPGAAHPTTLEYRRINSRAIEVLMRVDGKVTVRTGNVVSPDGKTRTVTETRINAQGQTSSNRVVFTRV
jgi:hypothetical protein